MATVDSLPADQRAVLQLVLQQGRSYEQIGGLLRIEPAAVRRRALRALGALAPEAGLPEDRRELIADYLLGQLPKAERPRAAAALAESPHERGWARVVASELAPLAGDRLPPIPADGEAAVEEAPPPAPPDAAPPPQPPAPAARRAWRRPRRPAERRGTLLIGLTAILAAVLVVLIVTSGSGGSHHRRQAVASTKGRPPTTASTSSSTSSTAATVLGQINLAPANPASKAAGVAEVLKEATGDGVAIVAENVPPNTTNPPNAYAVWLYTSPTAARFLGFVDPGVGANGRLSTAGPLPADAARYKELIITVETTTKPKAPGPILLQGPLNGL